LGIDTNHVFPAHNVGTFARCLLVLALNRKAFNVTEEMVCWPITFDKEWGKNELERTERPALENG
jgi:hypothetical protein